MDNSKGAEAEFVSNLRAALSVAGFEVEVREPSQQALYDTTVHFVVEGVSVRVPGELGRHELEVVAAAVRDAEARRSERRRVRAVPIYQGETSRVLAWVDIFASDALWVAPLGSAARQAKSKSIPGPRAAMRAS